MVLDARTTSFRSALLEWFREHARDYPWRHERTPYRTAIAEIMLRRTRADQVVPVYEGFVREYPTLGDAARGDPDTIRERLKPLGLEWRADNAVMFVREAHARYGDELPAESQAVKELPGAGEYVSAAVACFAGGSPEPLIDTNVVRVLGRVFGLRTDGEARRRREMRELAAAALDPEQPAEYHYALLDLAAKVCSPRKPLCQDCPVATAVPCSYRAQARAKSDPSTGQANWSPG